MKLYELPGNGKTDTASLVHDRIRKITLEKAFKDLFLFIGINAYPGITHFERQFGFPVSCGPGFQTNGDFASVRCEFKGVGKQVEQDSFDFIMIKTCDQI